MLKRQESSLSSSRRQATAAGTTPPPAETHHAKAIGCMSGIIQLFSKYQNSNKRLTFGRKHEKGKPTSPAKAKITRKSSSSPKKDHKTEKQTFDDIQTKKSTYNVAQINVPRSPTLPPEIRLSNAANSPENSRTPSSLVARLMGLEDIAAVKRLATEEDDSVREKRQRLLQALEKCNEDLESLKRVIKAVQSSNVRRHEPEMKPICMEKCAEAVAEEGNFPVEVAEEVTSSPIRSLNEVQNTTTTAGPIRDRTQQCKSPISMVKKAGEDDEPIAKTLVNKPTITAELSLYMRRRADAIMLAPMWCSRAMVESVEEVCCDIAWGEKREIGRIGFVLQDHLCRDLIEEFVKELRCCLPMQYSLPLEACKKRLRF